MATHDYRLYNFCDRSASHLMIIGTRMNLAIECCHPRLHDTSNQIPVVAVKDGNECDLSNPFRNSSKKHINNRKSLCQEYPQSNASEKANVASMCMLDQIIRKSELGHHELCERTQQRCNLTRQQQQPPIIILDGEKYDLSNLCMSNSNIIEEGSVETMCRPDQMIRKGEIFRRRQGERSQSPPVIIVDGEQWDVSNLYRSCCESLYPNLSQLSSIEEDDAQKMSRLHQTIRSSPVYNDRFRERSQQQQQSQQGPPVIVVDGKEYDLSNLCSSNSRSNLDSNESVSLELSIETPHVKVGHRRDEVAFRHAGGEEEEEVWQVDFPLHEISIMLPHAEAETVVNDSSFSSLDLSVRGPLETIKALGKECFACAECMDCPKPLHCTDNVEFILCPKCQCVGVKAYGINAGRSDSPFPSKVLFGIKGEKYDSPFPKTESYCIPPSQYRLKCPSS
jgi:hypothetical protein